MKKQLRGTIYAFIYVLYNPPEFANFPYQYVYLRVGIAKHVRRKSNPCFLKRLQLLLTPAYIKSIT